MKIAVTSKSFSKNSYLREKLIEIYPDSILNDEGVSFQPTTLVQFLKNADAAIIGLEKIDSNILSQLPNLKIISKYGVGLDNLTLPSLKEYNVKLGYTAGTNKQGVAELALQMMLILIRQSYTANLKLREGIWKPYFGNNLASKKVGILGLGNVGKELVHLLKPFNCEISCCELNPDQVFITQNKLRLVSIKELFATNDIVSIHIPLNDENKFLIDRNILNLMSAHSILINTSRGSIVDEVVLQELLENEKLAAAGFDVFAEEPINNSKLINLPNFFSTPHVGGSSIESVRAMGLAAINGLSSASFINN